MKSYVSGALIAMMVSAIFISCKKEPVTQADPDPEPQPDPVALATPSLTVSGQGENYFTVSWSKIENAVSYDYTLNDGDETSTTGTSVTFSDLTPGTYTVKVKAVAPEGDEFLD